MENLLEKLSTTPDSTLFLPYVFYLRPITNLEQKQRLSELLQEWGGSVTNKWSKNAITLADPAKKIMQFQ